MMDMTVGGSDQSMKKYTDEQISQVNNLSIIQIARQLGYSPEKTGKNYHIRDNGGLYLSETKNLFYCWAAEIGGGPIQFIMFTQKMNWLETMNYLIGEAEPQIFQQMKWERKTEHESHSDKEEFKLPEKVKTSYKRLFAYLIKTRGLDKDIVSDLVDKKKIYESSPHHNIVFVGFDENGQPRQAFQRGTVTGLNFKGEVRGSNKNYCFTMEGSSEKLTVYEAAIDCISHTTLEKSWGMEWEKQHRVALGGLSDNPLEIYLKAYPQIKQITFALDNDYDSKFSNGNPAPNWGQQAAQKLSKKYSKLGYETSIETPIEKDWNNDLLNMRSIDEYLHRTSVEEEKILEKIEAEI